MAERGWNSKRPISNLFAIFLLALAVACVRSVFDGGRPGAVAVAAGSALLLAVTAVAFLRRSRGLRLLTGATSSLLLLYSGSLALFGMEDVSGPGVAVPLALGLGAFGIWGLVLAIRKQSDDTA
jgi:hypothetical protein